MKGVEPLSVQLPFHLPSSSVAVGEIIFALVFVHEHIGPVEDHMEVGIGLRVENGKALRQG